MDSAHGQRLLIFGCGYVGSELARQAIGRGYRVSALTRNPQRASDLRALGVSVVVADLAESSWHHDFAGGADYVLNAVSSGGGGPDGYRRSYVDGMASILRWAQAVPPIGTFVYTSSTSVYPQGDGARVDETADTALSGELPQILLQAENLLLTKAAGIQRAFVLRLAGIYGPQRQHLVAQVRSGAVAGRGDYHLNLVHRDDIARAIWACFDAPPGLSGGIFNVADDGAATKAEIVEWMAQELGLPKPEFTGAAAAGRRTVTPDRIIDNARIKAELGWSPGFATFREGYKNRLALTSE